MNLTKMAGVKETPVRMQVTKGGRESFARQSCRHLGSAGCSKERKNLRPNVNTYLHKGLQVIFISKKQRLQKPK